ncbi:response regulator [Ferrovibrio xuzhouensis]|uniref:Response regulator n=1 Tax=Ferrovibrio xuzhouensis TaxID=1576914 RepID=A0ABV7VF41_9PROT
MTAAATILIIDDNADLGMVLRAHLQGAGYRPLVVDGARAGLALIEAGEIDLVITDILMPEVDGIELVRSVKRRWPDLPVIAMSGGGQIAARDLLDMIGQLGADHVLQKPVRRSDLLAAVEAQLLKRRPA